MTLAHTLKYAFLVTLLIMLLGLSACQPLPDSLQQQREFVTSHLMDNPAYQHHHLHHGEFDLHYVTRGTPNLGVVVWVHGTPGSWTDAAYLIADEALTADFLFVSLDRPGWGNSQYQDQPRPVPSMFEQVELISPLLTQLKREHPELPLILVGHSWGASLAPMLYEALPDDIDAMMLLAGVHSQRLGAPRWYNRLASWQLSRWVMSYSNIGRELSHSNLEMYALQPGLADSPARLAQIDVPTIVIQGDTDSLVDPRQGEYVYQYLPEDKRHFLYLHNQGHLLQMERAPLLIRCIEALQRQQFSLCEEQ